MRRYEVTRTGCPTDYRVQRSCACGRATTALVRAQDLWDYENGAFVQKAFPYLDSGQREAIFMSGICSGCWRDL